MLPSECKSKTLVKFDMSALYACQCQCVNPQRRGDVGSLPWEMQYIIWRGTLRPAARQAANEAEKLMAMASAATSRHELLTGH
ncbi:hypothetical protein WA026_023795 [Henosepilachna vigintioctopunctata]|uniref:Uncharacterized protein n=2 Tax=Henosepilachna vigintioctopunctata TaxID=420089 RepID=A0AAW1UCU1_9CUCU